MIISNLINNTVLKTAAINRVTLPNISMKGLKPLNNDVFEKSEKITDDKSFNSFLAWAEKTDFLNNCVKPDSIRGDFLGSGFEGYVYGLKGTDKWVLKQYKRSDYLPVSLDKTDVIEIEDISPELNIGQTIAKIRIPVTKTTVFSYDLLKMQEGKTYGIALDDSKYVTSENINRHMQELETISSLPQDTFDELIQNIKYIDSIGYQIDCCNPHNLLIDEDNKRINFIDINDRLEDKNNNQTADVLFPLLDGYFAVNFTESTDVDDAVKQKASKLSEIIVNKYCKAMEKDGMTFSPSCYKDLLIKAGFIKE